MHRNEVNDDALETVRCFLNQSTVYNVVESYLRPRERKIFFEYGFKNETDQSTDRQAAHERAKHYLDSKAKDLLIEVPAATVDENLDKAEELEFVEVPAQFKIKKGTHLETLLLRVVSAFESGNNQLLDAVDALLQLRDQMVASLDVYKNNPLIDDTLYKLELQLYIDVVHAFLMQEDLRAEIDRLRHAADPMAEPIALPGYLTDTMQQNLSHYPRFVVKASESLSADETGAASASEVSDLEELLRKVRLSFDLRDGELVEAIDALLHCRSNVIRDLKKLLDEGGTDEDNPQVAELNQNLDVIDAFLTQQDLRDEYDVQGGVGLPGVGLPYLIKRGTEDEKDIETMESIFSDADPYYRQFKVSLENAKMWRKFMGTDTTPSTNPHVLMPSPPADMAGSQMPVSAEEVDDQRGDVDSFEL